MTSKKHRRKARRSTYKLLDEAWEASEGGKEALAEKLSKRALAAGMVNPRVWHERGMILEAAGRRREAEHAYTTAAAIAPTYATVLVSLGALYAESGRMLEAVQVQRRAVELSRDDAEARATLAAYEARAAAEGVLPVEEEPREAEVSTAHPEATWRTDRYDWAEIDAALTRRGAALVPGLLEPSECGALRALWEDASCFEHEVTLDDDKGRLQYRFFERPLPEVVRALREEVYARAAVIANRWLEMLGKLERFPATHAAFLERCRRWGQERTTPILLRYEAGGFNGFHRDIHGAVAFPLQLAVTLGPWEGPDGGGELLLLDQRPGRRRITAIPTSAGDGVLFCSRERPVKIGGLHGLQPVLHGVGSVLRPERFAMGIPFHEYG